MYNTDYAKKIIRDGDKNEVWVTSVRANARFNSQPLQATSCDRACSLCCWTMSTERVRHWGIVQREQVLGGPQINRWRGESTQLDYHVNVVPAILLAIYMRSLPLGVVSLVYSHCTAYLHDDM